MLCIMTGVLLTGAVRAATIQVAAGSPPVVVLAAGAASVASAGERIAPPAVCYTFDRTAEVASGSAIWRMHDYSILRIDMVSRLFRADKVIMDISCGAVGFHVPSSEACEIRLPVAFLRVETTPVRGVITVRGTVTDVRIEEGAVKVWMPGAGEVRKLAAGEWRLDAPDGVGSVRVAPVPAETGEGISDRLDWFRKGLPDVVRRLFDDEDAPYPLGFFDVPRFQEPDPASPWEP
ncbi:hypothetical protein JW905_15300 [bacterium]|nr:hypothetical protein [candidate division CSSED10-310 bacterium]